MVLNTIVLALAALLVVPAVLIAYIFLVDKGTGFFQPGFRRKLIPWLWLLPAFVLLAVFLIYPAIYTIVLGFMNRDSTRFIGLANYKQIFTDARMLLVLRNNGLWLLFFTSVTLVLGLLIAVLTDRVKYEVVAKALIFIPYAISFVAAGVIWKFMYEFRPAGTEQIGTLNALLTTVSKGFEPVAWLYSPGWNNLALIFVGIWMWTGFATVLLSAALKGVSEEILEAARIDGATEIQVFFRITLPQLYPTITVISTQLVVTVLKVFDIVYVMTNGAVGTEVIANRMYKEMFTNHNFGLASAIAVILLVLIIPAMAANIKHFGQANTGGK